MRSAEVIRLGGILPVVLAVWGCEPSSPSVSVDKDGNFYWNDEPVSCAELKRAN
jgi:hypothetical protein